MSKNRILGHFCLLLLVGSVLSSSAWAQRSEFSSTRRSVATVMFCGLGGAVLGLSTLSFYGQPEQHISNIYVGLAVGLLAGTSYVIAVPEDQRRWARDELMKPMVPAKLPAAPPLIAQWHWDFP